MGHDDDDDDDNDGIEIDTDDCVVFWIVERKRVIIVDVNSCRRVIFNSVLYRWIVGTDTIHPSNLLCTFIDDILYMCLE